MEYVDWLIFLVMRSLPVMCFLILFTRSIDIDVLMAPNNAYFIINAINGGNIYPIDPKDPFWVADEIIIHANLLMRMSEGVNATIEVNWLTPMKVRTVAMTCSSGFALMDYTDQSLEFASAKAGELDITNLSQVPMELNTQHLFVKKEEPLKRELEAFLKAAEANEKAAVDGWDALANIKVCNCALRSLTDGMIVEVANAKERLLEESLEQAIESTDSMLMLRR